MNDEKHLKIWNTYQSAWAPIGEEERRALLAESVADDVVYIDPASKVDGVEALAARIAESQEQFPKSRFRNDSFLEHHHQGLFQWTMLNGVGEEAVKGTSFARFGQDGRLVSATGFFETRKG